MEILRFAASTDPCPEGVLKQFLLSPGAPDTSCVQSMRVAFAASANPAIVVVDAQRRATAPVRPCHSATPCPRVGDVLANRRLGCAPSDPAARGRAETTGSVVACSGGRVWDATKYGVWLAMRGQLGIPMGVCLLISSLAWAQDLVPPSVGAEPPSSADAQMPESVQPPTVRPDMEPSAPPMQPPAPPGQNQVQPQRPVATAPGPQEAGPTGQWVYTSEYGWLWMPYDVQYTYEGAATDPYPYGYVYSPARGWVWLVAPWVWGWGPYPYFGAAGPWHYPWYRGLVKSGYGWGNYRGGGGYGSGTRRAGGYRGGSSRRGGRGGRR